MKLKPIGTGVVIEEQKISSTSGGIALPETQETFDYTIFLVRDVGEGFLTSTGTIIPLPVKPGDRVALQPSAMGNLVRVPSDLLDEADRSKAIGTIDIKHIAGVWEGELPPPRIRPKIATPSVKDKAKILVA